MDSRRPPRNRLRGSVRDAAPWYCRAAATGSRCRVVHCAPRRRPAARVPVHVAGSLPASTCRGVFRTRGPRRVKRARCHGSVLDKLSKRTVPRRLSGSAWAHQYPAQALASHFGSLERSRVQDRVTGNEPARPGARSPQLWRLAQGQSHVTPTPFVLPCRHQGIGRVPRSDDAIWRYARSSRTRRESRRLSSFLCSPELSSTSALNPGCFLVTRKPSSSIRAVDDATSTQVHASITNNKEVQACWTGCVRQPRSSFRRAITPAAAS